MKPDRKQSHAEILLTISLMAAVILEFFAEDINYVPLQNGEFLYALKVKMVTIPVILLPLFLFAYITKCRFRTLFRFVRVWFIVGILALRLFADVGLAARYFARADTCNEHAFAIGLLVHRYREEHNAFPPSITNKSGFQHSWRVLLLEYYQPGAVTTYKYDQAWDAADNQKLQTDIPQAMQCPSRYNSLSATSYVAVTGPNCVLRDDSYPPRRFEDLDPDTIMIVETKRNDIHWMSPVDLKYEDLVADPAYAASVLGGPHPGSGWYITVDGGRGRIGDIGIPELLRRIYVPDKAEGSTKSVEPNR